MGPSSWNASAFPAFGKPPPTLVYSHVHRYLQKLQRSAGFAPRRLAGERPSLWFAEGSWSHHWLFTAQREAGRLLPAAEAFSTFRAMLEGSWSSYPDAELAAAWLNTTLADHGIGEERTPHVSRCGRPTLGPS